jgi:preprotein translocase subunit YajC
MSGLGLLLILAAFGFLYFVMVRPQRRRQADQQRLLNRIGVGDEIVTAGGLFGEITEVRDEEVLVRIAPEVEVRIARRAIAGLTPAARDDEDEDEEDEEDSVEPEDEAPETESEQESAQMEQPGPTAGQ